MPTRSGWNTPIRMFGASAGLVSGPRMLKIVRTPSSLRTGATFFIAGWWLGANMKPMPVSAIERAIAFGVKVSGTPSASSTSALADQHRGHHHRRHFAAHDVAHERQHLVVEDLAVIDRPGQGVEVGDRHRWLRSRAQAAKWLRTTAVARSMPAASTSR